MTSIYVIARNGGYEGHSAPVQAFQSADEAWAALALLDGTFEVFEVPIWPKRATEWYLIKPMKEGST